MAAIVVGVALELKHVVVTSLTTVSFCCVNCSFNFNSSLKQLHISNKTECFSYKSGCGVMHIKMFEIRAGLGYKQNAWLLVI